MEKPKFVTAELGNVINVDSQGKRFNDPYKRSVLNKDDGSQCFAHVEDGYKIAQHQTVYDYLHQGLDNQGLKYDFSYEIGGYAKKNRHGGRVKFRIVLPEVNLDLLTEGVTLSMRINTDNSYDCTTGLRMLFGASNGPINYYLNEEFARVYHKHTKSLDVKNIEKAIKSGMENFRTKMKAAFLDLINAPLEPAFVSLAIEEMIAEKAKAPMSQKYLKEIKAHIEKGTKVKNKWQLYHLACKVLSDLGASSDVEKDQAIKMLARIKKLEMPEKTASTTDSALTVPEKPILELATAN